MSDMKTIPSRAGFLAARSKGEKALARGLVIQAVTHDSDDWRIGLTATKKIGNAVTRNRARRRMRALARDHLSPMAKNGIDYVLIARHDTATANWQDMANGLQKESAIFIAPSPLARSQMPSRRQIATQRADHEPVWRFSAKGRSRFPSWVDCNLSFVHIATFGGKLSAFANMLTICERCGNHTWPLAWILLCAKTYFALSPLGRTKG